jgi:gamma-glutamylcyclotransferase (GGCT)/AIG2-like uncharacterized protein YtfP
MTEIANHQLFVYGSLRSGFNHPAYAYISDNFTLIGDAKVRGKLYDLGEYPAALPDSGDHFIVGELYAMKEDQEFSWVIAQIDDYEGVYAEPGESPLYRRELAAIYLHNQETTAWIYWYNNDIIGKPVISSGDVLQYLQQKKQ